MGITIIDTQGGDNTTDGEDGAIMEDGTMTGDRENSGNPKTITRVIVGDLIHTKCGMVTVDGMVVGQVQDQLKKVGVRGGGASLFRGPSTPLEEVKVA